MGPMTPFDSSNLARARPLRMRLLLLGASGLLPLLMLLAWGLDHFTQERRTDAERNALELSRALATAVDGQLRSTIALLDHMGTSDELERADLRAFQLSARRAAEQLGWHHVALSDGDGRVLVRTSEPIGISDPTSLDPASLNRTIVTATPSVSQVIVASPTMPIDAFAVRVPVVRGGKVVYTLSAYLPTEVIQAVLTRQNIPEGSVASIFDQVNRRVASSRAAPPPFPSPSLRALIDRPGTQGTGISTTLEGVESYTGYTRLDASNWVITVGTSVEEANKALYALVRAVALGLAASMGLSVLLAWMLSRQILAPIDALKGAAAALGRGDPVQLPPLDIVELDDVALALKAAAEDRDRAAGQITDALRAAEEANRSKDQFLAMLGHELRNPLAPIATAVQIMALKGDDRTVNERRTIERQLVHVTRLVDDLLDISRITSGRLAIRREPVRLSRVLSEVIEALEQSLAERALSVQLGPGVGNAWVEGDEVRLAQVFNNLLVNAVKFTVPGQSITVRAAVVEREALVDIEDTGVGLSASELERIFELFYQAPQSSDRARGGLGLGLPIVRSLLRMHGGTVQAASAGPGQGSRLTVRLPLCDPPAEVDSIAPHVVAKGAGRVLVVDDNEDAADTCATLLEMSGYTVRTAYTPESALDILGHFTPDVAVLDIGLPGMSGYDLARILRQPPFNYRGRLIALTGYGQAADVAASRAAGFDAHLTKPVAPATLVETVKKLTSPLSSSADTPS
jgi:signal transduction histidine kinase/ActR/RegA family two-component response regulator